ncbi:PfkB family carbohydrate kinase, partial [Acinetobacter baumannii]
GARWVTTAGAVDIPGRSMVAVDTVGAGDVFCGAMVAALSLDETFASALRFANVAAAISVTRHGAQASAPTRDEILALG